MLKNLSIDRGSNQNSTFTKRSHSRNVELSLLGFAWIIIGAFYVLASLGAKGQLPPKVWLFLFAVVATTLGVHFAIRRFAPNSNQILLPTATLLNGIGYIEIARWNPTRAAYQAVWYFISAVALVATLILVKRVRDLDRYRYLTVTAAIALLISPFVPGVGVSVYGARLWLALGPISFQPVEIAKILFVFFFASYLAANRNLLSTPNQRLLGVRIVSPRVLFPILAIWGLSLAILGGENDIGFAMLIFTLFIAMLWVTSGLKSYLAMGIVLLSGGMVLANKAFHQVHQRVSLWLDPWSAHNLAFSHQLAYGWFSLAAGGLTGTGLGLGQSGNIPEITSDMIFVAVGEELGLLGLVLVVSLFAVFIGEGFRIAQKSGNDFERLAATGLTALLGLQAFFIMAGVLRLLPFTGITVPFMAYGGSSLFSNYIIVALLLRISDGNANDSAGGLIVDMTL